MVNGRTRTATVIDEALSSEAILVDVVVYVLGVWERLKVEGVNKASRPCLHQT